MKRHIKCGLIETKNVKLEDPVEIAAYIWYEEDWKHGPSNHSHQRYQLTFVEEGYQYFHIENTVYIVPQNHVIWIPSGKEHYIESDANKVNLRVVLFKSVFENVFYHTVHVFSAPPVLKEMLRYAAKWNQVLEEDQEQSHFLNALLFSLPNFCSEKEGLHIPVPNDHRLISVCKHINTNFHDELTIQVLAEISMMSIRSLQRIFKKETGISIQKYVQIIRILKSIELIDTRQYTLSQIAVMVGYKSLSAFTTSYFSIMKEKAKVNKKYTIL